MHIALHFINWYQEVLHGDTLPILQELDLLWKSFLLSVSGGSGLKSFKANIGWGGVCGEEKHYPKSVA